MTPQIDVYLELGSKRVFAGALDWPGWCRSGTDEESAMQALIDYGSRYSSALGRAKQGFVPPKSVSDLKVVERLKGGSTTDFGAPGSKPAFDQSDVDDAELKRLIQIMKACWAKFDRATKAAEGKSLRTGPRGGGRDLKKMRQHVLEGEGGYLGVLGGKPKVEAKDQVGQLVEMHELFIATLKGRVSGEIPAKGARGGKRWPPRYAVRRAAWHVLDHLWELEDRVE
jgi:hypothetical protein